MNLGSAMKIIQRLGGLDPLETSLGLLKLELFNTKETDFKGWMDFTITFVALGDSLILLHSKMSAVTNTEHTRMQLKSLFVPHAQSSSYPCS